MHTAYIGMGANLPSHAGSPETTLAAAADRLKSLGHVTKRSSLYSTEPVGFADQPRFVNAVIELETSLTPRELLDGLLAIEKEFGRDRSAAIANGPRTLDLDILLFGSVTISEPGLEIPHPRLAERKFVLIPLREIASDLRDIQTGLTVTQTLDTLRASTGNDLDAVVPIQSENWRAGAGVGGAAPGARAGPGAA
jgi:2-amino-4-hydroxy-6-hydroxymethyldihydropteridine diphosphokinase